MSAEIPKLLHGWLGVPLEVEIYLRSQMEGEAGGRCPPNEFAGSGVSLVARRLLLELEQHQNESLNRAGTNANRAELPRLPVYVANWVYLLHCYCQKFDRPAPAALLRLTFAALGCHEQKISPRIIDEVGLPGDVSRLDKFAMAAALDGEADSIGEELSVSHLARECDTSRDTIRRWRQHPRYQQRRAFTAAIQSDTQIDPHGWLRAFDHLNKDPSPIE